LLPNVSHASTIYARGLCRRKVGHRDCNNCGGGGKKELVNSTNPHSPLIYLPGEGTWAETWRKERKREPTNGQRKIQNYHAAHEMVHAQSKWHI
jgi:hypothetical protein